MICDVDTLAEKFPMVLKEKIKNRELIFPEETKYEYNPILTYRAISREKDDFTEVTRADFKSYFELGKAPKKKPRGVKIEKIAEWYGVSSFLRKEIVEQKMSFPNPHKKMAVGYVTCEGGPQYTNLKEYHVCWWLFENADVSGYKIVEERENGQGFMF